jgi:Histidine kinase-, DNA gyrase B-, and HSP90-like ATPase
MKVGPRRSDQAEAVPLHKTDATIIVGKDILELLSSAMYVDPLTIYREYIQNSADSIDAARHARGEHYQGCVEIFVDPTFRTIRIRDNGAGLRASDFVTRLTSIGASAKRGSLARGFRGVGRLAGLGYCRELVFRSRANTKEPAQELIWDCRALRSLIGGVETIELADLVRRVVSIRRLSSADYPEPFFEVELKGVIRLKNDQLVSPTAVADYLSQVAPVAFHPEFSFREPIMEILRSHLDLTPINISINGTIPVYRPHRDSFETSLGGRDAFSEIARIEARAVDGRLAAVGWVAHHGYVGALPVSTRFKGLRFRCGDIQIGEGNLLEDLFTESRFNSWSVGEIHILDKRIVPNGRRDHFEHNSHYVNLLVQLAPTARDISRRCRHSSIERKWLRDFETHERLVLEKTSIISQRGVPRDTRRELVAEAKVSLAKLEKLAGLDSFVFLDHGELKDRYETAAARVERAASTKVDLDPLGHLPKARQKLLREMVRLIYRCSTNRLAARALVERIFQEEGLPPPREPETESGLNLITDS